MTTLLNLNGHDTLLFPAADILIWDIEYMYIYIYTYIYTHTHTHTVMVGKPTAHLKLR